MPRARALSPILRDAKRVLRIEAKAIAHLEQHLGPGFERAVELMRRCSGRVVVTGLGKSGVIGQKIAATLASTGTPSIFIHAAEAVHGDLGKLVAQDVVIAISNSGQTEEIIRLLPQMKRLGVTLIAMTGNLKSPLAKNADVVLDVSVREEACPLGLAPTASTTAVLALGDALAVAILNCRKFKAEDFAHLHPGGELGKSLVKVRDIMHTGARLPKAAAGTSLARAVAEMTRKKFGCVGVVGPQDHLLGIFTDGDLRRLVGRADDMKPLTLGRVMTPKPIVLREDELAIKAARLMQDKRIFVLLVVDNRGRLRGILHFLDLLDAGVM
jgi:arabinose-5-phosphate isomerase